MVTKSAMQELIGWIDKFPAYGLSRADVRNKATELLEKEKQMVIEARASLYSELLNIPLNAPRKFAEDYYNQTYINETK